MNFNEQETSTQTPSSAPGNGGRRGSTAACPVCCGEILPGDESVACPDCATLYHKDCWDDNQGCAIYGCLASHSKAVHAPQPDGEDGRPQPPPEEADGGNRNANDQCPFCCTPLEPGAETITCPHCKMVYHKECWNDNKGCATYGCPSAGCLNPPPERIDIPDRPFPASAAGGGAASLSSQCPYCHTALDRGATFCWSCGKEISGIRMVDSNVPKARPIWRLLARMTDIALEEIVFGGSVLLFFRLAFPDSPVDKIPVIALSFFILPFSLMLDGLFYALFGGTLGKWLFGVRAVNDDCSELSSKVYFHRNFKFYWEGMAALFPVVIATAVRQFRLASKGKTTYDEALHVQAIEYKKNPLKIFLGLFVLYLLLIAMCIPLCVFTGD